MDHVGCVADGSEGDRESMVPWKVGNKAHFYMVPVPKSQVNIKYVSPWELKNQFLMNYTIDF